MKRISIALALIIIAGIALAVDYTVNINIPVEETTTVNQTVTTASVDSLSVILTGEDPFFIIRVSMKNEEGERLNIKNVKMTIDEVRAIMPEVDSVVSNANVVLTANLATLLTEE